MTDLADQLRAALDQHERDVEGSNHICDCGIPGCVDGKIRDVLLRSIAAHRRIVERHAPRQIHTEQFCERCSDDRHDTEWPCPDLRDIASIYLPESEPTT